jgi:hypothetical protein
MNQRTARDMFRATVDHSFGDKDVKILRMHKLEKHWEPINKTKNEEK